jgi:hypothetical protein
MISSIEVASNPLANIAASAMSMILDRVCSPLRMIGTFQFRTTGTIFRRYPFDWRRQYFNLLKLLHKIVSFARPPVGYPAAGGSCFVSVIDQT